MKISLTHTFFLVIAILLALMLIFGSRFHGQPNMLLSEEVTAGKFFRQKPDKTIETRPFYGNFYTELKSGICKSYFLIEINPTQPAELAVTVEKAVV